VVRVLLTASRWCGSRLARSYRSIRRPARAIGLLGAFGISRLIASFFPGMHTNSLPVLTGVTLLLIAIALVACYLPARHASRISPTEALRAE